ncbi:MAG TPA: metal ABC transporter substrate-binding protein [Candidatus Polarisedimenticolia bacterium]|jgi:ABC-type Zn uptake system ZnuABC Zn-binding protein ZnuA
MRTLRSLLILILTASTGGSLLVGAAPPKKVNVVATLPNLASIAREVGGERVDAMSIATGLQDAHFVDPKPSYMVRLRSADLLLVNGLDLEIGWVPPLTQGARNARILPGAQDHIDCSARIGVMEAPSGPLTRAAGDVHPYGNPHYLTDPLNAEIVAAEIAEALARKDPAGAQEYEKRRADFVKRLHAAIFGPELNDLVGGSKLAGLALTGELDSYLKTTMVDGAPLASRLGGWMGRLRPYAGVKVITYHKDYSYFARRFGLDVVEFVEPKPGIPPSAKHLVEITERLGRGDVKMIITRPYVEHRSTDLLAEKSRLPVLTLPLEVGGAPEATDYFKLFDLLTTQIAAVAAGG